MRSFDALVGGAEAADVTGWGFGWLDGRATEKRPPWGYARMLAARLATARAALDIDTGGGEVVAEAPTLPARMCVTESWPPNSALARELLAPRGVEVYQTDDGEELPFPDESFDLVTSRHPVRPAWEEIHRVLVPGGHYFAQHVGPASAFELIEFFLGPLPGHRQGRDPRREADAAEKAGLTVTALKTAQCRMEFFDIGAVVWILRNASGGCLTSALCDTTTSSLSSILASARRERSLRTRLDTSSRLSARTSAIAAVRASVLPCDPAVDPRCMSAT